MVQVETLIKPKDAAATLGVSLKTLMEYVKRGDIYYIDLGLGTQRKRIAFSGTHLNDFKARRQRVNLEVPPCRSTRGKTVHSGGLNSKSVVTDFASHRGLKTSAKLAA